MAEELKGKIFEPKRSGSLSAKPIGAHIFQERGQVSDSAAPTVWLVSYCVRGALHTRIDDPRPAQEAQRKPANESKRLVACRLFASMYSRSCFPASLTVVI